MGPLGYAWGLLKCWENKEIAAVPGEDLVEQPEKSVILLAQAMHRVSWHRRVNMLSSLRKVNGAKITDIRALLK